MTIPTIEAAPRDLPGSKYREELARKLLLIGARKAFGPFGWAHPDCEALQEAARFLRGDPVAVDTGEVVLSSALIRRIEQPKETEREASTNDSGLIAAMARALEAKLQQRRRQHIYVFDWSEMARAALTAQAAYYRDHPEAVSDEMVEAAYRAEFARGGFEWIKTSLRRAITAALAAKG